MYSSKKIKIKEPSSSSPIPAEVLNKGGEKLFQSDGQLAVDVYENESNFVVLTAIAGISSKEIEIQIDKDMLIIKGCRPNPENNDNKNYFYRECHWGSFSRKIILPEDIDVSHSQAEFNKGLLMIKFPKNLTKNKKGISIKES
ncbi:Hsp20/alpha crystallin family protein [Patescibacteria group bacterium]|nr:Hsp20/alpha crystallin family protein [Patescibacteria group bacterium]MBU4367310.1 Hsp20/alpha crystallin family protein [Patescibacteria group bacterium]MBU4461647.1 Hsp20/alpha crystallin family protein [Patescibacteria group bacterium]MCG2699697.1 Hsp20/alpha crystallin family protein [Candidatus Parcubacteria bacterium]